MKTEHEEVLTATWHRMCLLSITERPDDWKTREVQFYDEMLEHGPSYVVGLWFQGVPNHERMRLRRAIDDLEENGLLTTWRRYGRKLTNIRLTPAGEQVAEKLQSEPLP
jgi:hypothetical protein